jgi:hypothetical protein
MDVHPGIERVVDRTPVRADCARRASEEIRAAARAPVPGARAYRPQLRASVVDYVGALRVAGMPVERTIEEVVGLVRDAEGVTWRGESSDPLLTNVVRWSIEAYYDDPALAGVPRFF